MEDVFDEVLARMRVFKEWKRNTFARDEQAAAMHAEIVERMTHSHRPLLLVSSPSLRVFCGPPRRVLERFAHTGEDVHPASVCLSRRTVRQALQTRSRKRKREDDSA